MTSIAWILIGLIPGFLAGELAAHNRQIARARSARSYHALQSQVVDHPDSVGNSFSARKIEMNGHAEKRGLVRIYAGNLPLDTIEMELRNLFAAFGEVLSLSILKDKSSGRSRGFAFVEMPSATEAKAAITSLNGHELGGYFLNVKEAFAPKSFRLPVPSMQTRRLRREERNG